MKAIERRQIARPLATVLAAAAAFTPAAAIAARDGGKRHGGDRAPYEERYLKVRGQFVDELGLREAGRNIVRDGYRERDGDVRKARRAEVRRSTERMRAALSPAPVPEPGAVEGSSAVPTAAAPTSVVECESGGDYGAVNPAGYYGAYQFDQQTWDAYAPSGYAGTNPAEAPPAVQDAAAANVPYDAWPNC